MPIRLKCACGKQLHVEDQLAGKTIRCPQCNKKIAVAAAAKGEAPEVFALADENEEVPEVPTGGKLPTQHLDGRDNQETQGAPGGYDSFRTRTRKWLKKSKAAIEDVPEGDTAALRKFLGNWAKELAAGVPPAELVHHPTLSGMNSSSLNVLGKVATRLADITLADVALDDWELDWEEVHRQTSSRIQLLLNILGCLAHRADQDHSLVVVISGKNTTPTHLRREDTEVLREALEPCLRNRGVVIGDDNSTRRLVLDITQWMEGVQLGTGDARLVTSTTATYVDLEDSGERESWGKTIEVSAQRKVIEDKHEEWAKGIVDELPPKVFKGCKPWAGAELQCPNCGHKGHSTEPKPKWNLCWRCGRDAITGATHGVLARQRRAKKSEGLALSLLLWGILIAACSGCIQWFTQVMPPLVLGAVFIGSAALFVWGVAQLIVAGGARRQAHEEQQEESAELLFPDAVKSNRKKMGIADKGFPAATSDDDQE